MERDSMPYFILLLLSLLLGPAYAREAKPPLDMDPIVGRASVIDGDTLDIHGTRIRLHGIDAPESRQTCLDAQDQPWRCGQRAALLLADLLEGKTVTCRARDIDRYRRIVGICEAGGITINAWMVENGLALAYRRYSKDYVEQESRAVEAQRGLWAGSFDAPWDWRQQRKTTSLQANRQRR
jgi:endonuclease YncB( thermonuclease family)